VRPAVSIDARRHDADRLPFEHRERHRAEVEHDVVGLVMKPASVQLTLPTTVAVVGFFGPNRFAYGCAADHGGTVAPNAAELNGASPAAASGSTASTGSAAASAASSADTPSAESCSGVSSGGSSSQVSCSSIE
jgi:hypothetical protein